LSRIGFAGLGDIGLPIALRLQKMVGPITVWNRSRDKTQPLVDHGARTVGSPQQLARESDLICLCLFSDDAVENVVFGHSGILVESVGRTARTIVNLSTGVPTRTQGFAQRAAEVGVQWLDAPVSGGVPAAATGSLTVFLGGTAEAMEAARPMLEAISTHWTLMGPPGSGQITKLCNQMIVASNILAIAEAVAIGRKAGIDVSRLPGALANGFADSRPLQIFGPRMADHVHEPRLGAIRLMLKDVEAAISMANDVEKMALPVTDRTVEVYRRSLCNEFIDIDEDLSAIIRLFE
jgi:3-hydroxyisobutyrate dehydrogenase